MTFGRLFDEYIERHAKAHKKTWQCDIDHFNRYLSMWSKSKLSTLTRTHIQKLHHLIGIEHGNYAANRLLALISTVFNKAREFGLYECANPAHGIKKYRERSRERFLQSDELPRFFKALSDEPNDILRDYVLLSLLTGARYL